MVKARKHVLRRMFKGMPKWGDVVMESEELPPLKDGQFLCQAVYLSVDPYQRSFASQLKLGDTMMGYQVARVLESRAPGFPVGCHVVGHWGWRDKTVVAAEDAMLAPDVGHLPLSLTVGALGMPGNTAYFGLLEVCRPGPGEVVVVTGAAGAVGSLVGQIAKIKGCRVIGFAGSASKCRWLKEDLRFDAAYNYKTVDVAQALREAAPKGVDVYFDNVGGEISNAVIRQMNHGGRVAVCGSISTYNDEEAKKPGLPEAVQKHVAANQIKIEAFMVNQWKDRWMEGIQQNINWIFEGKLRYRETVTEGFDMMLAALIDMLNGENFGKAVVKV